MNDGRKATTLTRPQISVRGATKSFSGRIVVKIDELLLGEQPIEGLIGPNGAGKTTLMRMIMHSTPLDEGTIEYFRTGEQGNAAVVLSDLPTYRMAELGVVKSNQVIMDFNKLTIWDSLLLAATEARFERPHRIFSERSIGATRTKSGIGLIFSRLLTRLDLPNRQARRSCLTSSAACSSSPNSCCSTNPAQVCPTS